MRFALQHGWGFSSSCWHGWLTLLNSRPIIGNRGYWGKPAPLADNNTAPGLIIVCHSLGTHLVPEHLIRRAAMLAIIGGFAHFHGTTPAHGRFTRRHIQRMLTRIATEPAALIHDFHRDCDLPEDSDSSLAMDTGLLAADLQLLNESRLEQHQCRHWPPTLLLHGRNDRIVAPQRAEELAALAATSKLTVIDDAGHGLPFTHPRLCLNLIVDFYHHIVHSGDNFL